MKNIIVLLLAFFLSGCIGLGTYVDTKFYARDSDQEGSLRTKQEFLAAWGQPAEQRIEADGDEEWVYPSRGDIGWRGIVIWVILPVPILVPVGRNGVIVHFNQKGSLRYLKDGESHGKFYGCNVGLVCGYFSEPWVHS